jgi:hypothetical protein
MAFELQYFDGRGLAEVSRLLFAATQTPFVDTRLPLTFVSGRTRGSRPTTLTQKPQGQFSFAPPFSHPLFTPRPVSPAGGGQARAPRV